MSTQTDTQVATSSTQIPVASVSSTVVDKLSTLPHDTEYYFDDEMAVFLVEQRLFKIHRFFLTRDSEFFRGLFACPPPPGQDVDGKCDARPIILHDVTCHEFRCLVRFLYESMYKPVIVSLEDWVALLSISTRFVFDKIRDMAILEISTHMLDPVKKVTLAERYNIPHWLPPAFADLCKRPEPITDQEGESLGLRNVVRVARARELARERGFITASQRTFFPHDKIYTFNDQGIVEVVQSVWPEHASSTIAA